MPQSPVEFRYAATYVDARGSEHTVITNDGETLRVRLRGVEFAGPDFDGLGPVGGTPAEHLRPFTLQHGDLCACRIEWQMPVPIGGRVETHAVLRAHLVLGNPTPNGAIDRQELRLVLEFDGRSFASRGTSGWFEDELLGIQAQLPEGVFIKACINCLYSDYSPCGHGLFGGMMCFRNLKAEYVKVTTKKEFWSVHGRQDRFVQETYLCPDFARRIPGTGYRG